MSTTQKYFERMRPNGWLLYFNCASTFSCLLYVFPLTAVKKNPANSEPDTADPRSNSGESGRREAREGAGWPCLRRCRLGISCQSWASSSSRIWPFQGESASDTSPCNGKQNPNAFQGGSEALSLGTGIVLINAGTFHSARCGKVLGKGLGNARRVQKHKLGNNCQREERRKDNHRYRSVSIRIRKGQADGTVPTGGLGPTSWWQLKMTDCSLCRTWPDQSCRGEDSTRRADGEGKNDDGTEQNLPIGQSEPEDATGSTRGKKANRALSARLRRNWTAHLLCESVPDTPFIVIFHVWSCSEQVTLAWATASYLPSCAW